MGSVPWIWGFPTGWLSTAVVERSIKEVRVAPGTGLDTTTPHLASNKQTYRKHSNYSRKSWSYRTRRQSTCSTLNQTNATRYPKFLQSQPFPSTSTTRTKKCFKSSHLDYRALSRFHQSSRSLQRSYASRHITSKHNVILNSNNTPHLRRQPQVANLILRIHLLLGIDPTSTKQGKRYL